MLCVCVLERERIRGRGKERGKEGGREGEGDIDIYFNNRFWY